MVELAENALTSLSTALDELGLTSDGGSQDDRVKRYINAASDLLQIECERSFYFKSDVAETVGSTHSDRLLVYEHPPIESITSIVYDSGSGTTTIVDADTYEIEDADAGIIRRTNGNAWRDTRMWSGSPTGAVPTGEGRDLYTVTYTGGWIDAAQAEAATSINSEAASGQQELSVASVEGFAAGMDIIIDEGNAGEETAVIESVDADNKTITVTENLSNTHSNGTSVDSNETRTLPWDIEDAVLQFVSMRWAQRGQDATVTRIGMMDGSIEYATVHGERVPAAFATIVKRYGRMHL